jgi:hypothetical protein
VSGVARAAASVARASEREFCGRAGSRIGAEKGGWSSWTVG